MDAQSILFTLAAIGISEAVYLIRKRQTHEQPVCVIGGDCTKVLESKYNHVFGVHNDLAGLAFYIAIAVVAALVVIGVEPLMWWEKLAQLMLGFALLMSAFFTYLQWRVIKAWCFWCLMSAGTVVLMSLIVFFFDIKVVGVI